MADAMPPPGALLTPAERAAAEHAALARLALSTWAWPAAQAASPPAAMAPPPAPDPAREPTTPRAAEMCAPAGMIEPPPPEPAQPAAFQAEPPPSPAPDEPPADIEPNIVMWLPAPAVFEAYRAAGGEPLVAFIRQQLATEAAHRRELERREAMLARMDAILLRLLPCMVLLALAAVFAVIGARNVLIGATGGVVVLAAAAAIARQASTSFSRA